jgi:F-box domain
MPFVPMFSLPFSPYPRTTMPPSRPGLPLPAELVLEVASWLSDADLVSLASTCKSVRETVEQASMAEWRYRFRRFHDEKYFDKSRGWKVAYQQRRHKRMPFLSTVRGSHSWGIPPNVVKAILWGMHFPCTLYASR